jgi:hypothetical protein
MWRDLPLQRDGFAAMVMVMAMAMSMAMAIVAVSLDGASCLCTNV